MLAQEQVSFAPALAALTAALIVAGPVSVAVTKVVDFVRNLFGANEPNIPSWVWQAVAAIAAFAICFGWNVNVANTVVQAVPVLANSDVLSGTAGTALTALAVFGMSSFWHDKMAQWSALAKANVPVTTVYEPAAVEETRRPTR